MILTTHHAGRQGGMALIVVLALMAVASVIAVSMAQSALLDERIAGNQRLGTVARMAAETAALGQLEEAPPDLVPSDAATEPEAGTIPALSARYQTRYAREAFLKARYALETLDKGIYLVAEGFAGGDNPILRTVLVRVRAPLGLPPLEAVFTCFGGDCAANIGDHINEKDHPLPETFQCTGNGNDKDNGNGNNSGCKTTADDDAPAIEDMKLYNGDWLTEESDKADRSGAEVLEEYAGKRGPWEDLLAALPTSDSSNTYDSSTKNNEMGMTTRDERGVIYIDGDVKFNGGTATSGILVVRDGAVLSVNGTAHHEGLILVEEGGRVDLSNGTYDLYGGMVMLKPDAPAVKDAPVEEETADLPPGQAKKLDDERESPGRGRSDRDKAEKPAKDKKNKEPADLVLNGSIRFAWSSKAWEALDDLYGGGTINGGAISWREVPQRSAA
ncbi:hypothetical protein FIU83_07510 [Halomonas sp. THAF5a]|uniref:pilus assembly PilX family protein n=1 Tax=Halomonas sp. THAF5a TaxID=2587844 RepID=UPI0012698092|nr:pilus assembly PilX N-terminal domain-containing protein [Halomonas sp. THAF5a]QFU01485.1 hypothetical protein FIU83_07510 [Halomonas sp. THAF5a]